MGVNIRDHGKAAPLAQIPQLSEVTAIELDNARLQALRVEIVIQNKLRNPGTPVAPMAKQERPTLVLAITTPLPETLQEPVPKEPGAGKLMLRCVEATYNLGN
jgi:hypothetical protein